MYDCGPYHVLYLSHSHYLYFSRTPLRLFFTYFFLRISKLVQLRYVRDKIAHSMIFFLSISLLEYSFFGSKLFLRTIKSRKCRFLRVSDEFCFTQMHEIQLEFVFNKKRKMKNEKKKHMKNVRRSPTTRIKFLYTNRSARIESYTANQKQIHSQIIVPDLPTDRIFTLAVLCYFFFFFFNFRCIPNNFLLFAGNTKRFLLLLIFLFFFLFSLLTFCSEFQMPN